MSRPKAGWTLGPRLWGLGGGNRAEKKYHIIITIIENEVLLMGLDRLGPGVACTQAADGPRPPGWLRTGTELMLDSNSSTLSLFIEPSLLSHSGIKPARGRVQTARGRVDQSDVEMVKEGQVSASLLAAVAQRTGTGSPQEISEGESPGAFSDSDDEDPERVAADRARWMQVTPRSRTIRVGAQFQANVPSLDIAIRKSSLKRRVETKTPHSEKSGTITGHSSQMSSNTESLDAPPTKRPRVDTLTK